MRIVILLIAALFASVQQAASQTPAATQMMSWQGLGVVRLGMSVAEAELALGLQDVLKSHKYAVGERLDVLAVQLTPRVDRRSEECWVAQRADGKDEAISYVVINDRIVVVAAVPVVGKPQTTNVTDMRGIGVGDSVADIRKVYGDVRTELAPNDKGEAEAGRGRERRGAKVSQPEPSLGYWVEVESPNHQRALVFDTRDGKVRSLRTGFLPEVMIARGCR